MYTMRNVSTNSMPNAPPPVCSAGSFTLAYTPSTKAAPAMPPPHWAQMYKIDLKGDNCLVSIMATVTAGFRCAPDTRAKAAVSIAAESPDARAVLI